MDNLNTPPTGRKAGPGPRAPASSPDMVTYRDATAWIDRESLDRALGYRRHYHTGGRRPQPVWFRDDLDDILGLIALEAGEGVAG